MRADRLVRLLMLLQSRKRWTAAALAERLEVAERTIYRDLDALSTAGIPVRATRGSGGGVALPDGFRTELTGLTRAEVHAIAALGESPALAALKLHLPLRSALAKLGFALPPAQQQVIAYARQRLHVDPVPFFTEPERVPHLDILREAVWQNRRARLTYVDFDGKRTRRVVDALGLVVKADRWYLVARASRGVSVFRGARIEHASILAAGFSRPDDFDLPTFWRGWSAAFAERRAAYEVRLRVDAEGAEALRTLRPQGERERIVAGEITIDFERESIAVSQLCLATPGVEVLEPAALRQRMRSIADALRATYR
jgi:predicted DNA-binding transcriptional regulator YafY